MLAAPLAETLRERPLLAIPVLFGAGVLTSFTPCIYPMIPITAGILGGAGAAGNPGRTRALMTLLYVLGLATVYALLGLIAGLTGSLFGAVSSNKWSLLVMGNLLLVSGLALLDVFTVRASGGLLAWASRFSAERPAGEVATYSAHKASNNGASSCRGSPLARSDSSSSRIPRSNCSQLNSPRLSFGVTRPR